jgi:predicted dehydrogenase
MSKAGFADDGRLNVAIVGLGWWGKTLLGDLKDNSKLRVAMTVDAVPAVGEWAQAQGCKFTTDFDAMLADPTVGAVILTTPHSLHARQILAAAKAKKHVFCEKPLTLTRSDALAAVAACESNNVVLGVGHEHRFKPAMQEVFRAVKAGELGTIQMTEATLTNPARPRAATDWRLQKLERPAGTMAALGIHGLDLSIAINGPAKSVLASVTSLASSIDDTLGILINFESGAKGTITSLNGPPFSIRFSVFGNKGWMELHDKSHPQSPQGWTLTKCLHEGQPERIEYPAMSMVRANVEAFVDAASGRTPYPVTHADMVANITAFEAIGKSADSGEIVAVEGN